MDFQDSCIVKHFLVILAEVVSEISRWKTDRPTHRQTNAAVNSTPEIKVGVGNNIGYTYGKRGDTMIQLSRKQILVGTQNPVAEMSPNWKLSPNAAKIQDHKPAG